MNDNERWVRPYGSVADHAGRRHKAGLAGRESVFAGPTDVAYVPKGSRLTIDSGDRPARIALCGAKAAEPLPFRHLAAADVPVEHRGAGAASRQVRNFGIPQVLDADSIIACEVVTPAGNWSSYPPHKHDEERDGVETELEEIYYFEVQAEPGAPEGADPVGYQRVYGTAERPIDVLAEVRTGDVVLVPHGWHGPAMAPPGYDLYYLNVMAGPGATRAWLICDDPAHAWVRRTWARHPGGTR
ncbi:5-deoxy-glucuronate isomerase [Nonomuraea sp. B19D2]|uniref:5-deoxy-glucuronate isomerase n=1 Tax=Nonomuraea sp. B19D2 TaxID=3159561 RepID=UPI0032DAE9DA